jgi:serine/threonine protein kinase
MPHFFEPQFSAEVIMLRWCTEAAEGLAYCHGMGVLHCDLRPDNLLLDGNLSIQICDFGGSVCGKLDGGGLPDYGFFDPRVAYGEEFERLLRSRLPDTSNIDSGDIIRDCWTKKIPSAKEALARLMALDGGSN